MLCICLDIHGYTGLLCTHLYLHVARVTRLHFPLQAKTRPTCAHFPTIIQPQKNEGQRSIDSQNYSEKKTNPDKVYQRRSTEPYVQMPMQR